MDIPPKTQRMLLLFLFLLICFFQYPRTEHMIGSDSFSNMGMSRIMMDTGEMPWHLHFSSLFGLYPYSYPMGFQTIAATLAVTTPLSLEMSYLLVSVATVFVGVFAMFMLAGELNKSFVFRYSAAFCFALTPIVLRYSGWSASARGPFILLLPVLLFLCFRAMKAVRKSKYLASAFVFLLALVSIHHMGLLLPFLFIAMVLGHVTDHYLQKVKLSSVHWAESSRTLSIIVLILVLFVFYLQFVAISNYQPDRYIFSAWFLHGDEPHIMMMNGLIYYTISFGVLLIFMGVGLARMVEKVDKNPGEWTLLFILLVFGNFLLDITYMVVFMVPLLVPFVGSGIYETLKRLKRQQLKAFGIFLMILCCAVLHSGYVHSTLQDMDFQRDHGSSGTVSIREGVYDATVYSDHLGERLIANERLLQRRVLGYTGLEVFPLENYQVPMVDRGYVDSHDIRAYRLMEAYRQSSDNLWYVDIPEDEPRYQNPDHVHETIYANPLYFNSTAENLSRYDIQCALTLDTLTEAGEGGYTGSEMSPPFKFSWFYRTLPEERYVIFRNDLVSIYWV